MEENENFKLNNPEFEAEIYYLTMEECGRYSPVPTGYRGQFYYNGKDWDATQEFIDKAACEPGESVHARLQTLSPIFHVGHLFIGQEFLIREGSLTLGKGKITKILRQDFIYWNYEIFHNQLSVNCKPFDWRSTSNFIANLKSVFGKINIIESLKFVKTLSDKNQMLTIQCLLKNNNIEPRPLIDEICKNWKDFISLNNSFYKIELKRFDNKFEVEFLFAIWNPDIPNNMYLTGKILISTR